MEVIAYMALAGRGDLVQEAAPLVRLQRGDTNGGIELQRAIVAAIRSRDGDGAFHLLGLADATTAVAALHSGLEMLHGVNRFGTSPPAKAGVVRLSATSWRTFLRNVAETAEPTESYELGAAVSRVLSAYGRQAEARMVARSALDAAHRIRNDEHRTQALAEMAQWFAELGVLLPARRAAQDLPSIERLGAFTAILLEHHSPGTIAGWRKRAWEDPVGRRDTSVLLRGWPIAPAARP